MVSSFQKRTFPNNQLVQHVTFDHRYLRAHKKHDISQLLSFSQAAASLGLKLKVLSVQAEAKFRKLDEDFKDKANVTITTYCSVHFDALPTNVVSAIRLIKS